LLAVVGFGFGFGAWRVAGSAESRKARRFFTRVNKTKNGFYGECESENLDCG
jgi:hypothetical protein